MAAEKGDTGRDEAEELLRKVERAGTPEERAYLEAIRDAGDAQLRALLEELRAELDAVARFADRDPSGAGSQAEQEAVEAYAALQRKLDALDETQRALLAQLDADRAQVAAQYDEMQRLASAYARGGTGGNAAGAGRRTGVLQALAWLLALAAVGYLADGALNDRLNESIPLATTDAAGAALLTFLKARLDSRPPES